MSKSSLKLKHFEIINLNTYFQQLNDDMIQDEEEIVDLIYEPSEESKFIFTFLAILSEGSLLYLEYNTTNKKLTKVYKNSVLSTIITNTITCCELSYNSPILLSTCLNEIIYIDTKQKPYQLINLTEENIVVNSAYCEYPIVDLKFNCNQSTFLVMTVCQILVYKIVYDKYEQKQMLQVVNEIKLNGVNIQEVDYSVLLNTKIFTKFSHFNENILYITYFSNECLSDQVTRISLENNKNAETFYLNMVEVVIGKKELTKHNLKCYQVDSNLVKICFTYFYEKLFFLFEDGIVCCVNSFVLNPNNKGDIFDDKLMFKYPLSSSVKFADIYFHPSSNFIVVKDTQNDYLIFDFTLNLYYIMHNSKITVKLNMRSFEQNTKVRQLTLKPYDIYYFTKSVYKELNVGEFTVDRKIQKVIFEGKLNNNSMFFYDNKVINGIFIEISSKFDNDNNLNSLLDEFQLLKNHLRGQNFDSSFKILKIIQNFNLWVQALFLIVNKLCHSSTNILLIKKDSLAAALSYLNEKNFDNDKHKNATVANIKNLCFTNLLYRCLSINQYEYAYLIAEKLNSPVLFKTIVSHSKLNRFYGISYLASNKLEVRETN